MDTEQGKTFSLRDKYRMIETKKLEQLQAGNKELLKLVKLSYRNWLEDPDVAWRELGEQLGDGLCNSMGDGKFQEWLKKLKDA